MAISSPDLDETDTRSDRRFPAPGKMHLNCLIDEESHQALKLYGALHRKTISNLVVEALNDWLVKHKRELVRVAKNQE